MNNITYIGIHSDARIEISATEKDAKQFLLKSGWVESEGGWVGKRGHNVFNLEDAFKVEMFNRML